MKPLARVVRWRSPWAEQLAGAALSLGIAIVLFTRFSINTSLLRDPAIYAYEGQQLSRGVAPYASIFDAKGPLSGMIAGVASALSRLFKVDEIHGIRLVFFAIACLTVLAVYLLAVRLWHSAIAGVVAATVLCSFQYFAFDALGGPDAKTPGIFLGVVATILLVERQWFWAAIAASGAFLDWQPFAVYGLVVLCYVLIFADPGTRRRAGGMTVAGLAIPVVVITAYFWIAGALSDFVVAALVFPLTGVTHPPETVTERIESIVTVARTSTGFDAWPFWTGLVLLIVVGAVQLLTRGPVHPWQPVVGAVIPSVLLLAGYSCYDFQGPPDLYPGLPYAALGFGGVAALILSYVRAPVVRRGLTAAALVAVVVFSGLAINESKSFPADDRGLIAQRSVACALKRVLGPDGTLLALGTPVPLVLTGRRNPDRFIYLSSGVDRWKVAHTTGGFPGWIAELRSYHPTVIMVSGWYGGFRGRMRAWLKTLPWARGYLGRYRVYLAPDGERRAKQTGVTLTHTPTTHAIGPSGASLPGRCG